MLSINNKQLAVFIIISLCFSTILEAQSKISGRIYYYSNNPKQKLFDPIPGASVKLINLSKILYTTTDENGYFLFNNIQDSIGIQIVVEKEGMIKEERTLHSHNIDSLFIFLRKEIWMEQTDVQGEIRIDYETNPGSTFTPFLLNSEKSASVSEKNDMLFPKVEIPSTGYERVENQIFADLEKSTKDLEMKRSNLNEKKTKIDAEIEKVTKDLLTVIQLHHAKGEYHKAGEKFETAILLDSTNLEVLNEFFFHHLKLGNLEKANAINQSLMRSSKTVNDTIMFHINNGMYLSQNSRPFESISHFEYGISMASQGSIFPTLENKLHQAHLDLGQEYAEQEMYIESVRCYSDLLKLYINNKAPKGKILKLYRQLGDTYFKMNRHEDALRNFEKSLNLIRELHDYPDSKVDSMNVLFSIGKLRESREEYTTAVVNYELAKELAQYLSEYNSIEYGIAFLEIANQLGKVYLELEEFVKALNNFVLIRDEINSSEFSSSGTYKKNLAWAIIQICEIKFRMNDKIRSIASKKSSEINPELLLDLDKSLNLLNECTLDLEIHTYKLKAEELKNSILKNK